jgi:hypothetical protein
VQREREREGEEKTEGVNGKSVRERKYNYHISRSQHPHTP